MLGSICHLSIESHVKQLSALSQLGVDDGKYLGYPPVSAQVLSAVMPIQPESEKADWPPPEFIGKMKHRPSFWLYVIVWHACEAHRSRHC